MEPIIDTYNKLTFFISEGKRKGRYEKKLMEAKMPKHPGRREGECRIQIKQLKQPRQRFARPFLFLSIPQPFNYLVCN